MIQSFMTGIVFHGEVADDPDKWAKWLEFATDVICELQCKPTHIGIESESMHSGKVLQLNRARKRVLRVLESRESVSWLTVLSLPSGFRTASFDYYAFASRDCGNGFVVLVAGQHAFGGVVINNIVASLRQHIEPTDGEVFTMDRQENPLFYAARVNPSNAYKTVHVLQTL